MVHVTREDKPAAHGADSRTDRGTDADVVIIGAGIAGLTLAHDLAEAGMRTIVLETEPVAGGCVRLHKVAGMSVDRGADAFALARPAVGPLAESLGLTIVHPLAAPAWVQFATGGVNKTGKAGAAPLPVGTLLGVPMDPTAADVRRVIGRVGVLRARLDSAPPRRLVGAHGFGSRGLGAQGFGPLVRRRMGRRVLRRLVEPVVAGVYSTDPADLDVDTVAPTLRAKLAAGQSLSRAVKELRAGAPSAGSAVAGIRGGMGTLTEALVAALKSAGGQVRLSSPAKSVEKCGNNWAVSIADGSARLVTPNVVIATEPAASAALVTQATCGEVQLPTAPATHVAIVTLVVDQPLLDAHPRGAGILVSPRVDDIAAKALTHLTAKWSYVAEQAGPGRHVLRLSYGRGGGARKGRNARNAAAVPPDDAFPELALRDASTLLGVPLTPEMLVDVAVVHYPDQLAARPVGQAAAIAQFRSKLAAFPGLEVAGAAVSGTGLAGVVTDATQIALAMKAQWGSTIGT